MLSCVVQPRGGIPSVGIMPSPAGVVLCHSNAGVFGRTAERIGGCRGVPGQRIDLNSK
jgi:hypothetical protein